MLFTPHKAVILRVCDFIGFAKKSTLKTKRLGASKGAKIKKVTASERSAARIYRITDGHGAQSKDPGDACWQMLFPAFQPQTTGQIKKVQTELPSRLS